MNRSITPEKLQSLDPHISHEHEHDEQANSMFGFIVFLLSESIIFLSFFAGYIIYSVSRTHEVHLTSASCPLPSASKR